jgi:hypothetical protein
MSRRCRPAPAATPACVAPVALRGVWGDGIGDGGLWFGLLTAPWPGAWRELGRWPCDSWGDSTIIEVEPALARGTKAGAVAAGSCQILARSGAGRRQPTGDDEHGRTHIGQGQTWSVRVGGTGGYQ